MKTLADEPINPSEAQIKDNGNVVQIYIADETRMLFGLTKREHFAAMAPNDFDAFRIGVQIEIVGEEPPSFTSGNETNIVYNLEYAKWVAKGRAIWKLMQADALIEALNKEGQ